MSPPGSRPAGSLPDGGLFAEGRLWEAPRGRDPSSAQRLGWGAPGPVQALLTQ